MDQQLAQLKSEIIMSCIQRLQDRRNEILLRLEEIRESASSESKSAMGDKYETATEMAAMERENQLEQLHVVENQWKTLSELKKSTSDHTIGPGSLVKTDSQLFYLSVSLGKIMVGDYQVMVISSASPLGQKLLNGVSGDQVEQNGQVYKITGVA